MKKSVDLAALLVILTCAAPLAGQSFTGATGEPSRAGFGAAIAVNGEEVFIGEGWNVLRSGLVYVYRRDDRGGWTEVQRLTAPTPELGDGFGRSVTAQGGTLLVGQRDRDSGSVHAFEKQGTSWRHAGTLTPADQPGERYGAAVALDGDYAAVGAPGDDSPGRVHIFRRDAGAWTPVGVLVPADGTPGDGFGAAISLRGTRLLVGAPGAERSTGGAYVFRLNEGSGEWQEESRLAGEMPEPRAGFGSAVALAGSSLLVSAPRAEQGAGVVFGFEHDPDAGTWTRSGTVRAIDGGRGARFGSAIAIAGDGAYVGAPGAAVAGAVYRLERDPEGRWRTAEELQTDQVAAGGGFGAALAVGEDIAVAGATGEDYGAGAAVILIRRGSAWAPAAKLASEPESLSAVTGREARCEAGSAVSLFDCGGVDLLSFLPVQEIGGARGVELNDIWGWTDPTSGREFALVGRIDGTSFVEVTDPVNPRYLGDLPMTEGSNAATWRDIKVYGDHAFVVADGAGQHGVQVFDLSRLLDIEEPVTFDVDAHYDGIASAHNIVVDTTSGFAFAVGARDGGQTCGGGLHMIDVRDPLNPEFAGCFADPQTGRASTGYSHDAQCVTYQGPDAGFRGREICLGANETALSIADVTEKDRPVALARAGYPNVGYTHQGWLTPDQRYFYMNDELDELQGSTPRTRTLIWDVSDLSDPQLVGEFLGTTEASDHNLYIRGTLMYQSNYQAGLRIIDISDPLNPREVGYFDTVPHGENRPGFDGSWSNYPYFPSGTIVVTSGREGLFMLRKREPVS